jgi:hypothetical protein
MLSLYIEALNEVIDLHETRVMVGLYARVPVSILSLLLCGTLLTLGMVGYSAGLTRQRSPLSAVVLIGLLGATITLVLDLDRSREGFLQVSQRPLIDLAESIGAPSPPDPRR